MTVGQAIVFCGLSERASRSESVNTLSLLQWDIVLAAPVAGDVQQRLLAKIEPGLLNMMTMNGVFKRPECPVPMNRVQ